MKDQYQYIPSSLGPEVSLFAAAMNATSCGIVITDHRHPDHPIIYCNEGFETLTGYSRAEIIGHNCRFLQGNDNDQKAKKIIKAAITQGKACKVEIRNYTKSGKLFWNELILTPIQDSDGKVTNYIGVQNDITRLKATETLLNQGLENKHPSGAGFEPDQAQENPKAQEDRLEKQQDEQRRDDFISLASHEMKTPLTSIKGYVQVLKKMAAKNGHAAYLKPLNVTANSVDRLGSLVNVLLDAARLQSGKLEFMYTNFDFDELVKSSTSKVQAATETHLVKLSGQAGKTIRADFFRLEQTIINLLDNAIKYSPGAKEVGIHVSPLSDFIKVAITDSGIGIHPSEHKKIFERFYRVEKVKQGFQGIGMGLFLALENIKAHQGTLWVESEEGKGSVFSFTIPANVPQS